MEQYGYARVSTRDQNAQRQIDSFYKVGLDDRHIFIEKESGKDFNRAVYHLLTGTEKTAPLLREGDVLIICSLDRLGRNYNEVQEEWRTITKVIGADIQVLDMPLLNTVNVTNTLDNKFIKDLVLQILSYVAQKERENNKIRQREGIEAAKRAGKVLGRPAAQYPDNWEEIYIQWQDGKLTPKEALSNTHLSKTTFYKLAKRYENEQSIKRKIFHNISLDTGKDETK